MKTRQHSRVVAFATGTTLELIEQALSKLATIVYCVDIPRLRREYGSGVADEVVRQLVTDRACPQERAPNRRSR